MKKCGTDNVSEICNKLADKHDLNVTVVRDLVEDLRAQTFAAGREATVSTFGVDIYRAMRGEDDIWVTRLAGSRKPAKPARKRG